MSGKSDHRPVREKLLTGWENKRNNMACMALGDVEISDWEW